MPYALHPDEGRQLPYTLLVANPLQASSPDRGTKGYAEKDRDKAH